MFCCPTCGQQLPADRGFIFDEEAGIVVGRGRVASLTRQEATVFAQLYAAMPRVCTKEQLLSNLYLHEQDEAEIKIVDVFICKIRKKLAPLGVEIATIWARGYRLVRAAESEAA